MTSPPPTLAALMQASPAALHDLLQQGHPLDLDALAGRQYLGVDLSLPRPLQRLLWQTFRKTFVRDGEGGPVRGWNVRLRQRGVEGPQEPLRDAAGRPRTFGHYVVRSGRGVRFPRGVEGVDWLDYGAAGNLLLDPARFAVAPLVALQRGDMRLLLGWELVALGPWRLPLPSYWALQDAGPVEDVIAPPRPARAQLAAPGGD